MSTKITTIYDNLNTLIGNALTTYTRMPNAYEVNSNNDLYLKKGYAVGFGAASNTNRVLTRKVSIDRIMNILLVNQITTTDHNTADRATCEKGLMVDVFTILKAVEADQSLGGQAIRARYESDSGLEFIEGDRFKYFINELNITVEYIETTV